MIQKPGTELPWSYEPDPYSSEQIRGPKGELVAHVIGYGEAAKETAAYIVHACNRFPETEKSLANAPKPRQDAGRVEALEGAPCGTPQVYESTVLVKMPDHWKSDKPHRSFCVDACIWPEVAWLINRGVRTVESCCGHIKNEKDAYIAVATEDEVKMRVLGYADIEGHPGCFMPRWQRIHVSTVPKIFKLPKSPEIPEFWSEDYASGWMHDIEFSPRKRELVWDHIRALQAALTLEAKPQPTQEATYDGQTAQELAEAWDRENDRWQAIVMHHEELETAVKKLLKFLKMRYPNMNTKFPGLPEVEKIMAQTGDNPALTLEAKPQTDNGGLVEAAKEIMKLNFKHRDFCRVDLHVSVDGGKCTCGVWTKLEKMNAAIEGVSRA